MTTMMAVVPSLILAERIGLIKGQVKILPSKSSSSSIIDSTSLSKLGSLERPRFTVSMHVDFLLMDFPRNN